ncbi:MAG: hypothetical protein ACI97A_004341, partial [Planctomycetota bacterium]
FMELAKSQTAIMNSPVDGPIIESQVKFPIRS